MTQGRPLTDAEINLCRSIFNDAIDYRRVRVFNRKWWPFQPRKVTMAPDGNIWFHPNNGLFCDDFCGAQNNIQALFIHEMVHVWQHQQGVFLPLARHPFCSYDYELLPEKPFRKYGIEQQAEIVSHVFLLKQGVRLKNGYTLMQYANLLPF
ncbi:vgr related protein [Parasphingorhabdus halotolerans]|uniref:Vgr related protein n=1 Tax=Parasphingorhabdus halotolerans TaxID=2725558 RepID=A0A6H2DMR7_9SPHN|nr:vgr related protein [Parasphingorhabdus halotolerans]QJB68956.1 vgr related protein [Parasphingorhabdus halotolerans]